MNKEKSYCHPLEYFPMTIFVRGWCRSFLCIFAFSLCMPSFSMAADFAGALKGVTVTDSVGGNQPPSAVINFSVLSENPYTIQFDAGASVDADGSIVEYKWNYGDGATGLGQTVSHQFTSGDYAVTLSVLDNKGGIAVTQTPITVILKEVLHPNSDVKMQWTATPNINSHFSLMSDNNDATYTYVSNNWQSDTYGFTDTKTADGKIIAKLTCYVRAKFPAGAEIPVSLIYGAKSHVMIIGTGNGLISNYSVSLPTSPFSSTSWTPQEVNGLSMKYSKNNFSGTHYVYELAIEIEYQ